MDGPETSPLKGNNGHPSLGSVGESLSETYRKWRGLGGPGLQQRISVGKLIFQWRTYQLNGVPLIDTITDNTTY